MKCTDGTPLGVQLTTAFIGMSRAVLERVRIAKYGAEGDIWQRRCELYLLDCGVTQEEIVRLREILLESAK